jgi:hypothetical protein
MINVVIKEDVTGLNRGRKWGTLPQRKSSTQTTLKKCSPQAALESLLRGLWFFEAKP